MAEEELRGALAQHFGFDAFRPGQETIVASVCSGRDNLVVMPTGGGKSLCYQLPALIGDGVTLVISPLIALMKDQTDALAARGIPATLINSSLSPREQADRIRRMAAGEYKLIYVAPERFRHRHFVEQLRNVHLGFVAVDEAHCVSQWGHDFRPDYLRVGEAIQALGHPPVNAFTATATPEVRSDIVRFLGLRDPQIFVTGFARPNLNFSVEETPRKADKFAAISRLIGQHKTAIIYCATRKRVEEVASHLAEWGLPHIAYHGGMSDEERESLQNRFIRGEVDVAVATNAFGMGIDRGDLRLVLHFELPGSVEAYYQEAGRAGRDGLPAHCVLLYNYADRRTQDFFIDGTNPPPDFVRGVYHQLLELADEQHEVRRTVQELTEAMGAKNGMMVGTAMKQLADAGVLERFDLPGERMRGTRLLHPERLPFQLELDEAALAEKEDRDRSKLEAVISYATARSCRQTWMRSYFGEADSTACHRCDRCRRSRNERPRALDEQESLLLRKLLSGVARMSDRRGADEWVPQFGRGLILQMLAGSEDRKLRQLNLDRLSTFGLLRDLRTPFLRKLFDAALDAGYLYSTGGLRPLVTLTTMGSAVMRGKLSPEMTWPVASSHPRTGTRSQGSSLQLASGEVDEDLLGRLRQKRLQLAKARGNVPAYTILPNRALEGLAALQPSTVEEALAIPGIGPAKARTVLPAFLRVISDFHEATARPRRSAS